MDTCDQCGEDQPPGTKFCGYCGEPRAVSVPGGAESSPAHSQNSWGIVVSADGNEVEVPGGMSDQQAGVEVLRGRYRHETGALLHFPGAYVADGSIINQMRSIAASNYKDLPGLPKKLRDLVRVIDLFRESGVLPPSKPKTASRKSKALRRAKYTEFGRAYFCCQGIISGVLRQGPEFVEAFDGQPDMLVENTCRFLSAFFPELTSLPNKHHGDDSLLVEYRKMLPELASDFGEADRVLLDPPAFSPVHLLSVGSGLVFKEVESHHSIRRDSVVMEHALTGVEGFDLMEAFGVLLVYSRTIGSDAIPNMEWSEP